MLAEWVEVTSSRDDRVREAVAAGLSKHRVHVLTRIARTTVDRILAADQATPPSGPDRT